MDNFAREAISMAPTKDSSAIRFVVIVCAAQVLVQIGAFFWPALLPEMMARWSLSNSEAGWITAIFYAAYIIAVPVLTTLTDRVDAKRVYIAGAALTVAGHGLFAAFADGFWSALASRALAGAGWAGTYMVGLKLLADKVDAKLLSRAAAGHAGSIGVSGALSFGCADLLSNLAGWRFAFLAAALSALTALVLIAFTIPGSARPAAAPQTGGALFDFRPVLRNRSAMAYAIAYCLHTFEMSALRGWGVAFLAFVATATGSGAGMSPTTTLMLFGLIGTLASVLGNEAAILFGRRRLVALAMIGSAACALVLATWGAQSYHLAVILILIYAPIIWLDSSSLTAGTAGTAEPARRGATLAVHSMLGYIGGFVGPLAVGWILDFRSADADAGWASAFTGIAVLMALALVLFLAMRPRSLEGDRA
jgi:predicted MFS family arabinose efflux permease